MGAEVRASRLGADSERFAQRVASSDTFGNVRLDSLPAGDWHVEGLRIGYKPHSTVVRAVPGCRTVVELYLEYSITCLFGCPTTPPRAVVTACAA